MVASADKLSKGLPTAQEVMEKLALAEAEKASQKRASTPRTKLKKRH